jgi:hypothetical protein
MCCNLPTGEGIGRRFGYSVNRERVRFEVAGGSPVFSENEPYAFHLFRPNSGVLAETPGSGDLPLGLGSWRCRKFIARVLIGATDMSNRDKQ